MSIRIKGVFQDTISPINLQVRNCSADQNPKRDIGLETFFRKTLQGYSESTSVFLCSFQKTQKLKKLKICKTQPFRGMVKHLYNFSCYFLLPKARKKTEVI